MISKKMLVGIASAAALMAGTAYAQVNPKLVIAGKNASDIGESNMINIATAEGIAKACEKMAVEHKQDAAIVVLDNFGNLVYFYRMDGAARATAVNTAQMKAKTALMTRRPSSLRQYNVERNPDQVAREFGMGYFPTGGGMPIWAGTQIIGFLGVGGMNPGPDWSDEICGYTALTQVVGQQPPMPQRPAARP